MLEVKDFDLWTALTSTVTPLKHTKVKPEVKALKFKRNIQSIEYSLDLHGYSIQDAYKNVISFISKHYKRQTKRILIITGKGKPTKEGLIHHEIVDWLNRDILKQYIKTFTWVNNSGAIQIYLKRK